MRRCIARTTARRQARSRHADRRHRRDRRHPSAVTRHPRTGTYSLLRVNYPAAGLLVVYVRDSHRPAVVVGVVTTSTRYHTATGLRVGSSLAAARHTPGIHCFDQVGYFACQGGLGYEKPVTSFTVRNGRVVRVFMVAVAD